MMEFYGLFEEIGVAIRSGKLIVLSGTVGCGKTVILRRLQEVLRKEGQISVCKSLSVDKSRTTFSTLLAALFYDLSSVRSVKIPRQREKRERELRELIRRGEKPVALFVDDAHDLPSSTLTEFNRLIEVVEVDGGILSIVLAGLPDIEENLRRLKDIGGSSESSFVERAVFFSLQERSI